MNKVSDLLNRRRQLEMKVNILGGDYPSRMLKGVAEYIFNLKQEIRELDNEIKKRQQA